MSTTQPLRILYCHCTYARIVPADVKSAVLNQLAASGIDFEAVPDLCEMSARRDPRLQAFASQDSIRIAACFPRAVHGLFEAAGCRLSPTASISNMRMDPADKVAAELLAAAETTA